MFRNLSKNSVIRYKSLFRFYSQTPVFAQSNTNTIDNDEISKFKKLVGIWWDEEGDMKALHTMNTLRVPLIRDGLINNGMLDSTVINSPTPLKNINILDVGCGGGILSEPLAKLGANVTGVDACEDLIKCANLHAIGNKELKEKITYLHSTIEDITNDNKNKFDVVVSSECIEHVASKEIFLKCCVDVLKPGGSLFLTTLNKTTTSWILGIVAAEYILNIVPKGTHDWQKFVSPQEIQKLLEQNNAQMRLIHGMFYNVVCNKWHWTTNTSVNYALHAVKNV